MGASPVHHTESARARGPCHVRRVTSGRSFGTIVSGMTETDFPIHPRIAVIGAGAVGAYYGAMLARGGHDVHFLFHSDADAICASGLRIESYKGNFVIP